MQTITATYRNAHAGRVESNRVVYDGPDLSVASRASAPLTRSKSAVETIGSDRYCPRAMRRGPDLLLDLAHAHTVDLASALRWR